jgi:hypothetical protein
MPVARQRARDGRLAGRLIVTAAAGMTVALPIMFLSFQRQSRPIMRARIR